MYNRSISSVLGIVLVGTLVVVVVIVGAVAVVLDPLEVPIATVVVIRFWARGPKIKRSKYGSKINFDPTKIIATRIFC